MTTRPRVVQADVAPDLSGYRRLACAVLVQTVEHATRQRMRLDGTTRSLRVAPAEVTAALSYLETPGFAMFAMIAGVDADKVRRNVRTTRAAQAASPDATCI